MNNQYKVAALFVAVGGVLGVAVWRLSGSLSGGLLKGLMIVGAYLLVATGLVLFLVPPATDERKIVQNAASAAFALGLAAAPVLVAIAGGTGLSGWIRVYVAGGFGGLVLELVTSRGQVELPGPAKQGRDSTQDLRGRLLPEVDLGFLARFLLGGLAAVVVLMIGAGTGADDSAAALDNTSSANLSIAWAIAIGSASTTVWQAVAKMVQARLEAIASSVSGVNSALDVAHKHASAAESPQPSRAEVERVVSSALLIDPSTITNVDDESRQMAGDLLAAIPPAGPESGNALLQLGATVGALEAAQAQVRGYAKRAGISLPR